MQRLYSTFANGWPGKGLVVLRVAVVAFVLHHCFAQMNAWRDGLHVALAIFAGLAGLLLLAGLWTPAAATLLALFGVWSFFTHGPAWDVFLGSAIAVGLAFLGPGAYSVDARAYGRKRISIGEQ